MTDEEMTEEYIQNGTVFVHNKVTIESIKQAFLAGLKAGRQNEKQSNVAECNPTIQGD